MFPFLAFVACSSVKFTFNKCVVTDNINLFALVVDLRVYLRVL
jgi:hypothetical protein